MKTKPFEWLIKRFYVYQRVEKRELLSAPAAILGGFLWESVTPMMPFLLMILIDAGVRMPLIYFLVPESKREVTINS